MRQGWRVNRQKADVRRKRADKKLLSVPLSSQMYHLIYKGLIFIYQVPSYHTYLPFMCSEDSVQLLWTQVAIISQHVEVHIHRFLFSVCHTENVDTPCSDRQGFRQEVPECLQPALPLDARVDKIPCCKAFGRRGECGLCVKRCCCFGDNNRVDQNLL